jgi:hypothetical protein
LFVDFLPTLPRKALDTSCAMSINDVSDRDTQVDQQGQQHLVRAKSRPGCSPVGPYLTTGVDGMKLDVWTKLNGKYEQQGNTSDMLFAINEMFGLRGHTSNTQVICSSLFLQLTKLVIYRSNVECTAPVDKRVARPDRCIAPRLVHIPTTTADARPDRPA